MEYVYLFLGSFVFVIAMAALIKWLNQPAPHKPAVMSQYNPLAAAQQSHTTTEQADALLTLGQLLSDTSPQVKRELTLYTTNRSAYFAKYADDLDGRGIEESAQVAPVIALIDALMRVKKVAYHDWKADPLDVLDDLNHVSQNKLKDTADYPKLIETFKHTDFGVCEFLDKPAQQQAAVSLFSCAKAQGLHLLGINENSDAYALILVAKDTLTDVINTAERAGIPLFFANVR